MKTTLFLLLLIMLVAANRVAAQQSHTSTDRSAAPVIGGPPPVLKDEADMNSIRPVIEELNRKMVEAFKLGDLLAVSRFYADDATIFSYRGKKIQGREAIDKYWTSIKDGKDWKLEVLELGGDAETVYQIGRSILTTAAKDGKENTYACDFIVLWKKQKDGTYKIHVDIYN